MIDNNNPMTNFAFNLMSIMFKFRDIFSPPKKILREVGIKPNFHILDYGCGPGSFSIAAAKSLGESGKVYALDIHALAIKKVQQRALKEGLKNIETIHSGCETELKDSTIDVVLLYDIFHELKNPNEILKELYRILKPEGILSFSDHHMKEHEILVKMTDKGLFSLLRKGKKTYSFHKK